MTDHRYVDLIVDLAKQVETQDPIDWGMLTVDEDQAYRLIASQVVETMYDKYRSTDNFDVLLATIVKLVVENFTLHVKLNERL